MHHLPFAEASLGHKHRKRVGAAGQPDESGPPEDSGMAEDGETAAGEEDLYQRDPPASAHSREEVCPFCSAVMASAQRLPHSSWLHPGLMWTVVPS